MGSGSWIIGSQPDCDIWVDSPTVSGRHCRLTAQGDSFLLEDLQSSNGTFVANERVTDPRIVRRGDVVTLGRNVPLPWPAPPLSITIGRLPDNDLVIPMETVSSHHASLERDGASIYLVDCDSTNGTAINDPLNKIKRSILKPTDFVFFGTHRVSAADLLNALPQQPARQATVLERDRPEELVPPDPAPEPVIPSTWTPFDSWRNGRSWLVGVAISGLIIVLTMGAKVWRQDRPSDATAVVTATDSPATATPPANNSSVQAVTTATHSNSADPKRLPPDEAVVRRSELGIVQMGLRIDADFIGTKAIGWAYQPDRIICLTSTLTEIEAARKSGSGIDEGIVVAGVGGALAILSHRPGEGNAAGFSVATLETPLQAACKLSNNEGAAQIGPGQPLALLSVSAKVPNDPTSAVYRLLRVSVERVERAGDKTPSILHCSSPEDVSYVVGAPAFDVSGGVVGCVQSIDKSSRHLQIIPIARLASLLRANP